MLLKHEQTRAALTARHLTEVTAERDAVMRLVMEREDAKALQAQMEDAALYIAALKQRMRQMEQVAAVALHERDTAEAEAAYFEQGAEAAFEYAARAANNAKSDESSSGADVFSLTNVKKSIESAVHDMASLPENEQRKKIKQLRLRWHPDKNPVLGEFAAEVTYGNEDHQ